MDHPIKKDGIFIDVVNINQEGIYSVQPPTNISKKEYLLFKLILTEEVIKNIRLCLEILGSLEKAILNKESENESIRKISKYVILNKGSIEEMSEEKRMGIYEEFNGLNSKPYPTVSNVLPGKMYINSASTAAYPLLTQALQGLKNVCPPSSI